MKRALKKYFIPHAENKYHPHFLHAKRALAYSTFFIWIKAFLVGLVLAIPLPAFVAPDVLSGEQARLVQLTNTLRARENREPLVVRPLLNRSSALKADDMAVQQYFSHNGPDDHNLKFFLKAAGYGYRTAGENLAMGFFSADEVLSAWVKSPTHYKNLIDSEYLELGTSMVAGLYNNIPTAYAVAHFGTPPITAPSAASSTPVVPAIAEPVVTDPVISVPPKSVPALRVLSQKSGVAVVKTPAPVEIIPPRLAYDADRSQVLWKEAEGGVLVQIQAYIQGSVKTAQVEIAGHTVTLEPELSRSEQDMRRYAGSQVLPLSKSELFRVVVPPTLSVIGEGGEIITGSVAWHAPPIITPSSWQRYTVARRSIPLVASIVDFSNSVYIGFLALFLAAFVALVVVEARKQHPHVIVQTLGVIALLLVLIIT